MKDQVCQQIYIYFTDPSRTDEPYLSNGYKIHVVQLHFKYVCYLCLPTTIYYN